MHESKGVIAITESRFLIGLAAAEPSLIHNQNLHEPIATYGSWAVGIIIGLESMGLPLPGETTLVLSALYAHKHLNIWGVIGSAAAGAFLGDNVGYWIGREFGYPLLLRYRRYIGLSEEKIKLGQYLFLRHGGKVVFFGRFIAVLRVLAALLAGINRMPWASFLIANAAGGILWAAAFGWGAYTFGRSLLHVHGRLAIALLAVAVAIIVVLLRYVRAHEAELEHKAEQALPGPLQPVDWKHEPG